MTNIGDNRRGITPAIRREVLDPDESGTNTDCFYCGMPNAGEIDHVVPWSRGGGLDLENLVPACHECNSQKRDLTPEEWASKRIAAGKPWPIPHFFDRYLFLMQWGGRPRIEYVNGALTITNYRQFRNLLICARDVDILRRAATGGTGGAVVGITRVVVTARHVRRGDRMSGEGRAPKDPPNPARRGATATQPALFTVGGSRDASPLVVADVTTTAAGVGHG